MAKRKRLTNREKKLKAEVKRELQERGGVFRRTSPSLTGRNLLKRQWRNGMQETMQEVIHGIYT